MIKYNQKPSHIERIKNLKTNYLKNLARQLQYRKCKDQNNITASCNNKKNTPNMTQHEFQLKFDQLENILFAFAMRLTRNKEDAKDLIQETVCKAYKNKDRFRRGTNFKAWMTTIMHNSFVNIYRKRKTRNKVEAPIENFAYALESRTIKEQADSQVKAKELFQMLYKLSETYRIPFWMHYQGYQYDEIASHLDIPIGTVKSRIFSARKNLKAILKANYGDAIRA